jgi:beta-glucosidase
LVVEEAGLFFPPDFGWGAATSAYQVEGNITANDWAAWELTPGSGCAEPAGTACDHVNRFRDDIALLAELGLTWYRFSVEWSRIEPFEGHFDHQALDHYGQMIAACHDSGLQAGVAFHHFTNPLWVRDDGGWENPRTVDRFREYCEAVSRTLGAGLDLAITMNEPNIPPLLGYSVGWFPPGLRDDDVWGRVNDNFLTAHEASREVVRQHTDAPVGLTLAMADWQLLPGGEEHLDHMRGRREDVFLVSARSDDFIGVNTYTRHRVGRDGFVDVEEGVELTDMAYEYWPEALEATVRRAAEMAGVPVIVTESGIATDDDQRRIAYIDAALRGVHCCISDGIDVRGFHYWSALDNFEWNHGYRPKFGLIAVDRRTQERTVKPSGRYLGRIAAANALG